MSHGIWKSLGRPEFGMINSISEMIRAEEWRNPDLLTSVRAGPTLIVASDYGGEHGSALYRSFSFLVADLTFVWYWDEVRQKLRESILKDTRRIAFKHLEEGRRARVLMPFLRACNSIPGLLATFLIDKRVQSCFREDSGRSLLERPIIDVSCWRPKSFEKLCRVAHFGSMLVAGLSGPGQNVLWVTDQDEIVPNFDRHRDATALLANCMSHYISHPMGHFRLATTQSDTGSRSLEDLVAIPDLAAGALAEVASVTASEGGFPRYGIQSCLSEDVSRRARVVFTWLADGLFPPLRRLTFIVEYVPPQGFKAFMLQSTLDFPFA